ncbi:MAG: ATP-dependent zinc metalloprotease FtsH, partial [Parcubacteria group bacterium GW2011_GWA2_51_12]
KVAQKIDEEISNFLNSALKTAAEICRKYRQKLEIIAQQLIKAETIEQEEFNTLVADIIPAQKRVRA